MGIFTKIKVKCSGSVNFDMVDGKTTISKTIPFTNGGKVRPFNIKAYVVREQQFCSGSASRQKEILDVMIQPGITKGLKTYGGLRYLVDGFKSFVEAGYKSQFGSLAQSLDDSGKFVRCILNEPFLEDLQKSTNPLFKDTPSSMFDWKWVAQGGNPNYSTNFLSKFTTGDFMCFFFGTGFTKNNNIESVPAGKVSNLFYLKTLPYDVVANESGYVDGVNGIETNPDDIDRGYIESFNMNPIIKMDKGFTIYQNLTGQKKKSSLQQITASELLCYIKETLYNMAKNDNFKKGTYNNYLTTETEITNFMEGLALSGAIEANPIVQCNATINTREITKQKIKLVHIEYTAIDTYDKVVFDLNLN